jgi:hypothetical protein
MAWVKEWDHCVFGKAKAKRRKRALETVDVSNLNTTINSHTFTFRDFITRMSTTDLGNEWVSAN